MSTDPSLEKGFRTGSVSPLTPLSWGALSKNSLTLLLVPLPMAEQVQVTQDSWCLKAGAELWT